MGRPGGAVCLALAVGAMVVAAVMAGAPSAAASCGMRKPREQLAQADAAFVGHLVSRDGDRLTFSVVQRVKGELADEVVVVDRHPKSPMSLRPAPSVDVGLFLRRDAKHGLVASDCDVVTPEAMRAAEASGRTSCRSPEVVSIGVRRSRRLARAIRVRLRVDDPDGDVTAVDIAWGDGAVSRRSTSTGQTTLVTRHRYRRHGRFRIAVVARSAPALDCGFDEERSAVRTRYVGV